MFFHLRFCRFESKRNFTLFQRELVLVESQVKFSKYRYFRQILSWFGNFMVLIMGAFLRARTTLTSTILYSVLVLIICDPRWWMRLIYCISLVWFLTTFLFLLWPADPKVWNHIGGNRRKKGMGWTKQKKKTAMAIELCEKVIVLYLLFSFPFSLVSNQFRHEKNNWQR